MKIKNNIISYLLTTLILIFSVACEELDFVDPNEPSLEQTTVQTLVTGIEAGLRISYEFYIRDVSAIGREAYYLEPSDPRYTGTLMGKDGTTMDPSGFLLVRPWSSRYRVIRNCNFLLENNDPGANGFAKTIMAYQLLLNLNMTHDGGIRIDVSGDVPGPFVSREDALNHIASLLDEAKGDLEGAGASFGFSLSNGFSGFDTPADFLKFNRGLKARVSIYMKDYSSALIALGESFLDEAAPLSNGVYLDYGTGVGDLLNPIYEVPDASTIKLLGHPSFVADAEAGDARVTSKTFIRATETAVDGLTSNIAQTVSSSQTDPFPIMRNEELILLRAEANIGSGNTGTAESDINIIRQAAGLGNITLDSGTALDELLIQKRYSLFLEGFRWIDMRLYNKLDTLPIDRPGDVVHVQMPRPSTEI